MEKIFNDLIDLKAYLDKYCVGNITTWKDRILLESVHDEEFCKFVLSIFNKLEKDDSSDNLNEIFKAIRIVANKYINEYNITNDLIAKYEYLLKIERYFGIIEQIDELSIISENTYKNLIEKYGYSKIQQIDKDNPSKLTNTILCDFKKYNDDEINKYIVLKNWQDEQNIYSKQIFDTKLKMYLIEEDVYDKYLKNINVKTTIRKKFELYKMFNLPYIDIDLLSKYYLIGFLNEFKCFVGGKGYGLAILNCYSQIPKTYLISYATKNIKLDFLNNSTTYAVRSSADCEDGSKHSFAGMFDSFLDVPKDLVFDKIQKVFNSKNNSKVKEYLKSTKISEPNMNVIIQEYINPDKAGVWLSNSINSGIYELVNGVGENLVSGKIVPTTHNFSEKDKLACFFVNLQKEIGFPCDFEFCIKDNKTTMLQCRPVTTVIKTKITTEEGLGASSGITDGEVLFLESPDQMENNNENNSISNKILVTYATDPNWLPIILKSKGIVTLFGGYLCHTAIISRELNIPCVVGVNKEVFNKIIKSKKIKIDGSKGKIEILE
ncbi:MAG: PEP/pyruvate-binding domain-containing protein [Christensenellales bacterium]